MKSKDNLLDIQIERIAKLLVLNSSFIDNSGLDGKLGVSIFFFHYCKAKPNSVIYNCACVLLDEVFNELNIENLSFKDGLSGLGIGIQYLSKNGFVTEETDLCLQDVDIILSDLISNKSSLQELIDLSKYYISRISHRSNVENVPYWNNRGNLVRLTKILLERCCDSLKTIEVIGLMEILPSIISLEILVKEASEKLAEVTLLTFNIAINLNFKESLSRTNPLYIAILLFAASERFNKEEFSKLGFAILSVHDYLFEERFISKNFSIEHLIWLSLYIELSNKHDDNRYKEAVNLWKEKAMYCTIDYKQLNELHMGLLTGSAAIALNLLSLKNSEINFLSFLTY